MKTIEAVSKFAQISQEHCIKTLLLKGIRDQKIVFILACCLGDDEINLTKCSAVMNIQQLECASQKDCEELDIAVGYLGPYNLITKKLKLL